MEKKEILLEIVGGDFGYRSTREKKLLLSDINLDIRKGELVSLIGRNGSGKTTILRSLMRLQPLLKGEIKLAGQNIDEYSRIDFAQWTGYVSTEIVQAEQMRLRELVELGRFPYTNWIGKLNAEDRQAVDKAIRWVGLERMQDRMVLQLSDGERQRAMIARTLAQNTSFIILDEPSAFLDIPNKYDITSLLRELCFEGKTVLFSTHDLNLAIQFSHKIWLIDDENIIEGAPEDLIMDGKIEKLFDSLNIHFNRKTADFEPRVQYKKKISLINSSEDSYVEKWTRQALVRNRIKTDRDNDNSVRVEIFKEKDKIVWKVQTDDKNLLFENLYELTYYLTNT